ncbi:MAG: hypothetical protein H0V45_02485 [Actinobacteria bacterium]|nr:hypothetical protein [Actinomycetota bacterium]
MERESQFRLLEAALEFVEQRAEAVDEAPRDFIVNHVVEINEAGSCDLYRLPTSE